ncbi:unnamed protein product [Timema podura]|uniref:Uncharacterized protein n=1 Tax=Timema podura TaxID=61482 RepID=A0ABN7NLR6_TIMPD|nr:unnamed protein product [Timema podura]
MASSGGHSQRSHTWWEMSLKVNPPIIPVSPMASLVLTDSSQLTSDSQQLGSEWVIRNSPQLSPVTSNHCQEESVHFRHLPEERDRQTSSTVLIGTSGGADTVLQEYKMVSSYLFALLVVCSILGHVHNESNEENGIIKERREEQRD